MAKVQKFKDLTHQKGQGNSVFSWPFFVRPFGSTCYHAIVIVGGIKFGAVSSSKSLALAKAFVKAKNYFPGLISRDRRG